ncbi:MAG: T9SS C-terminal target domain-containing protein, partial [Bacteroidia bacterium]
MIRKYFSIVSLVLLSSFTFAQNAPFSVYLEPVTVPGVGGLQAFAFGQDNGKWLIVGGRLDGLHRRQPFASFDVAGNNNQLLVVEPVTQQSWSMPLTSLSVPLQEQLSSTNMEFHQEGNYLYI